MATPAYIFGEFRLDPGQFTLTHRGHRVRLERKPLELLVFFAASQGRLVTRAEIAQCLWGEGIFVDTEHGINTAIRKIRHALREDPERPCFLETVTGKGYRFTGAAAEPCPANAATYVEPQTSSPELAVAPKFVSPTRRSPSSKRHVSIAATVLAILLAATALVTFGTHRVHGHVAGLHIDPAAIDAYQQGRFLWFSQHRDASGAYFLRATQLAPSYAPAWAGLADYYGAQMVTGELDPRRNLPLQDAAAHRAVQLDGSVPEAHLALGGSDWVVSWDYPAALRELDRAIQLDPRFSEAHHLRSKLLIQLNRAEEGLAEQRLAMQLNPFERSWALGNALLLSRRYDAAIAEAHLRLEGTASGGLWDILSRAYEAKGLQKEAEEALEKSLTLEGDHAAAASAHWAFVRGGRRAVLQWILADLNAQSKTHYVSPYCFAEIYAGLGEKEQALDALEETVRQHSPLIFDVQNDFYFERLHTESRYRAIVQRIGLPPSW